MMDKNELDEISDNRLKGFFVDWRNPPNPQTHLKLLKNSSKVMIAVDNLEVEKAVMDQRRLRIYSSVF